MAETFLSPVIDKLLDLLIKKANSLKGVHRQVESIKDELEIIEPVLRDAEAKSERGEVSDATRIWMKQLRDVADRIEDVVDEHTYHLEHHRSQCGFSRIASRHDIASEIEDIEESLQKIKDRGLSYGLRPFEQGSSSSSTDVDPRIGSLFVNDDELVGVKSVSEELLGCLVEGESKRTVISLVGESVRFFDHHVWVTVSQSYNIHTIIKKLMKNVRPSNPEFIDDEESFTLLRNSLQAKRYVIVFDDVWQTDFWRDIRHALPNDGNRSRILVTTRNSTVVDSFREISCDMIVKELKAWSTDQAWELFCKKAFSSAEIELRRPSELKDLSLEILRKCQGLALAIVAVAGLLSKKEKSKVEWQRVLSNLSHEFEDNRELSSVSKILLLSYHDLPYDLRLCFRYFGVFPEDSSLDGDDLYRLWIAEGLIRSKKGDALEQIAEQYLTELISRNLVTCELVFGDERRFQVHDLIYEMISRKNNDLNFCQHVNKEKLSFNEKSRRWSISDTTKNSVSLSSGSNIRSVLLNGIEESTVNS